MVLHYYKEQQLYRATCQTHLHKTTLEESIVNSFFYNSIYALTLAAEKTDDLTEKLHVEMP